MSVKTRSELQDYWNTYMTNNQIQAITGPILNVGGIDIIDSVALSTEIIDYSGTTAESENDLMYYDGVNWTNKQKDEILAITDLTDANITTPTDGQFMQYNAVASKWVNITPSLNDINNVTITSPFSGQTLYYDGDEWINQLPSDFEDAYQVMTNASDKPNYLDQKISAGEGISLGTQLVGSNYSVLINCSQTLSGMTDGALEIKDGEFYINVPLEYTALDYDLVFAYLSAATDITTNPLGWVAIDGPFKNDPLEGFYLGDDYIIYSAATDHWHYFKVDWCASIAGDSNGITASIGVAINQSAVTSSIMTTYLKTSGEEQALSGTFVKKIYGGDEIQLICTSDGNDVLTFSHFTTSISKFE